ncbi:MAG: maleylacetoacetate isomerase [Candidatus Berkiellales bacterium]
MFRLYDYFRSSSSFRVRIALNLKEIEYELIHIHLLKEGGEHLQESYRRLNPQGLVPCLEDTTTNTVFTQSIAIIEYLEETFPTTPLLPENSLLRAKIRAFAQAIACEIHPLNNLRVLRYLVHTLQISEPQKTAWYHHWLKAGFDPLEQILNETERKGPFCFGDTPTLADVCLIPQVYNAERFEFDLKAYPTIKAVYDHCLQHPAFIKALPENQPAAQSS